MFGKQCETIIKLGCGELRKWFDEYSTKLCYLCSLHIPLLKNESGEELAPVEVEGITELVEFTIPVTEINYRQTSKHQGLSRLTSG